MCNRSELEQLERLVEKSKQLTHSSEMKVEELEATIRGIQEIQTRFVLQSSNHWEADHGRKPVKKA